MTTANQKILEFERLKSMASNGQVHEALRMLIKIAKKNNLTSELKEFERIKESLEFMDAHLQANSMDPQLGGARRNRIIFDLLDLINNLEERNDLEVGFHGHKSVNLVLSSNVGLNEDKKRMILKTLEKLLDVSGENIGIEQLASR